MELIKKIFLNIANRLRPRNTFRWIFSVVAWSLILVYIGFGIYFGLEIYKNKQNSSIIKAATRIYPFPAALVNGKFVWASSYYQQLDYINQFSSKTKQSFSNQADLKKQIIDQLAENEILEFQGLRYNVHVSNKEFNDAYAQVVNEPGETAVKKVLNDLYGMSEGEFKKLVWQKVLKEKIQNSLMVQIQVAHILIKDEKIAKDTATKAQNGDNFADLAKQYSAETNSRDKGGELGWVGRGQLVTEGNPIPEFDSVAFSAKIGEIVGPIKTPAGYEIAKIEGRRGVIDDSFDHWLSTLKSQAKIVRFIN